MVNINIPHPFYLDVVSLIINSVSIVMCSRAMEVPRFLALICLSNNFIEFSAILLISCFTVVIGIIDSYEIGELSKPIISYSSGIFFLLRIRIFNKIFAWVSLLKNIPFLILG